MSRACFATCWAARLYMRLPNSTLDIANRSHRPRTRRSPARCAGRGRPLQKATSREMIHSWHGVLVPAWVGRSRLQSILSPRNTGPQGLVRVKLREASLREPAGRCAWECLLPRADHPERVGPPGSLGRQEPWRAQASRTRCEVSSLASVFDTTISSSNALRPASGDNSKRHGLHRTQPTS